MAFTSLAWPEYRTGSTSVPRTFSRNWRRITSISAVIQKSRHHARGLTLIEMLIVVAIMCLSYFELEDSAFHAVTGFYSWDGVKRRVQELAATAERFSRPLACVVFAGWAAVFVGSSAIKSSSPLMKRWSRW